MSDLNEELRLHLNLNDNQSEETKLQLTNETFSNNLGIRYLTHQLTNKVDDLLFNNPEAKELTL